jgi:hypothetical protein
VIRSLTAFAAIPLLAISAACSNNSSPVDELAGETAADDAGDGKADSAADGVYTYFEVTADLRKCAAPICGGYFFQRLNRTTTKCVDGSYHASCYAPTLDWSKTTLGDAQQQKLVDAANQDAMSEGTYGIVRGYFASQNYGTANLGRFVVTEAWVGENPDAVSDGVFVKVADNGIRCITAPCPSLTERALNTSRSANVSDIDWTVGGFSDREIQGFSDDFYTAHGTIISGDRYYSSNHGKGRTATQGFHMLAEPVAAP